MKKTRILVCDDEEGVRESLNLVLGKTYQLTFANDGEAAIALAQKQSFAAALVDIKMPRMNGLDVLKWFRQHQPATPVLMLTAYQSVEMAREAVALGAADYLSKPFEQDQLKEALTHVLETTSASKKSRS